MTCRVTIRNSSGTGPDRVGTCWKMVIEEGQGSAQGLEHLDLQRSSDRRGWSADSRSHIFFLCLGPTGNHALIRQNVSLDGRREGPSEEANSLPHTLQQMQTARMLVSCWLLLLFLYGCCCNILSAQSSSLIQDLQLSFVLLCLISGQRSLGYKIISNNINNNLKYFLILTLNNIKMLLSQSSLTKINC